MVSANDFLVIEYRSGSRFVFKVFSSTIDACDDVDLDNDSDSQGHRGVTGQYSIPSLTTWYIFIGGHVIFLSLKYLYIRFDWCSLCC